MMDGLCAACQSAVADHRLKQCVTATDGWLVGWLEFNAPFQHKYGYIRDKKVRGGKLSSYPVKEG